VKEQASRSPLESASPLPARVSTFAALRLRDYRFLWTGSLAFFLGMNTQTVARGWLAYHMTSSPLLLSLTMVFFTLPMTILSLLGGAVADRAYKPRLVAMAQALNTLQALAIALLITFDRLAYWHLLVAGVVGGVAGAFNMPARQALVREVVPSSLLMNAIALNTASLNLSQVLGPALAGGLISTVGPAGAYYLIAGLFLLAGLSVVGIRSARVPGRATTPILADVRAGLAYLRRDRLLLLLMGLAMASIVLGMPYQQLMPAFVVEALGVPSAESAGPLGLLLGVAGVGALVGSLLTASLRPSALRGRLLLGSNVLWGLALALLWVLRAPGPVGAVLFGVGLASAVSMAVANTLIQWHTAPEMQGRVMSVYLMNFGWMSLGAMGVSGVAEVWGTPAAIGLSGVLLAGTAGLAWAFSPRLRRSA